MVALGALGSRIAADRFGWSSPPLDDHAWWFYAVFARDGRNSGSLERELRAGNLGHPSAPRAARFDSRRILPIAFVLESVAVDTISESQHVCGGDVDRRADS